MDIRKLKQSLSNLVEWIREGFEEHRLVIRELRNKKMRFRTGYFFVDENQYNLTLNSWTEPAVQTDDDLFYDIKQRKTYRVTDTTRTDVTEEHPLSKLGENLIITNPFVGTKFIMIRADLIIRL